MLNSTTEGSSHTQPPLEKAESDRISPGPFKGHDPPPLYHAQVMRGWRKALYTLLWSAARAFELASGALTHLAAGTLRLQDLRGAIVSAWEEFGRSEELIRSGLMPWESALYDRFVKVEDRILVVGCGTGRDLIALLKLGYRVEGLDVGRRAVADFLLR